MSRMNKILCLSLVFLIPLGLTACINKEDNKRNIVSKTQPLVEEEEVPEYVMTKEVFKNKEGEVYGTVKYNYDDQGHLLEVKYINQEGKVIESKRFKYNEQRLRTKRIVTKACKKRMSEEWRYNTYDRKKLREKKPEEVWYIKVAGWPIWNKGTTTYKYNKWGQLVAYKEVKENGAKVRWGGIKYYKDGERKYKWIERYDGTKKEIYYNENGKWENKEINYEDGSKKIMKADYDKKGNKIEELIKKKTEKGNIVRYSVFKSRYNNEGQLRETKIIDKKDESYFLLEYKYNKNNNKIKTIKKNEKNKIEFNVSYKYNNQGKRIFYGKNTGGNNYLFKTKYQYNNNNDKVGEVHFLNGKMEYRKKYYYEKLKGDK